MKKRLCASFIINNYNGRKLTLIQCDSHCVSNV